MEREGQVLSEGKGRKRKQMDANGIEKEMEEKKGNWRPSWMRSRRGPGDLQKLTSVIWGKQLALPRQQQNHTLQSAACNANTQAQSKQQL